MDKILTLALKDLRLLVRDRAGFFFTCFFPLIIAVLFGTIFGGGEHTSAIPLLLVDEDGSRGSRAFVDTLTAAPELKVLTATREQAMASVRRGKVAAYVVIKPGFGEAASRAWGGAAPAVELGADPARRADVGMIEGLLMKYAAKRFQGMFPAGQASSFEPIAIERVDVAVMHIWPASAYAITFPQGIIWGFIGVTAAFGISIVSERARGTLLRLQVASIGRWQILAGKALACFLAALSVSIGLLALAYFAFGVRPGSWPLLALAVVSSVLSFVGLMMLLSVLGRTAEAASGIGWAVLLVLSMLGGGMVPYFFMPSWMSKISSFSTVKWSVMAMEGAIWRHYSFGEMLLPCGILVGSGIVLFAIGVRAFAWASTK
ncbi:MAG TPA: ABC transporter permease [bacterium]|nr:ABC transporter permease [bacterium]